MCAPASSAAISRRKVAGFDQRRIGKHHQHVAAMALQRRPRRQHRIARCRPGRAARKSRSRAPGAPPRRAPRSMPGPPPAPACGARCLRRCQHVGQHRAAADRVQHLGQVGAHAHALAGSQHDDQQGSIGHRALLMCGRFVLHYHQFCNAAYDYATIVPGAAKRAQICGSAVHIAELPRGSRPARHNAMASEAHVHNPGRRTPALALTWHPPI